MAYSDKICHADPQCHNECKLKIYDFDGRRSVWGGECGRYDVTRGKGTRKENLFDLRDQVWQTYMAGVFDELREGPLLEANGRPTIGMQRALYGIHSSVLWAHFFDHLGFRLVLTAATTQQLSKIGIESMAAETCYPVKVSFGHVRELAGKTRFLFLPTLIDMPVPNPSEVGYYCPMVQSNAYMVRSAFKLDRTNLLSPSLHMKYDPDLLAEELSAQVCRKLGVTKTQVKKALRYAMERQHQYLKELKRRGRDILENLPAHEPVVTVTGRPYNLYDERVNLRIGQNLSKIGLTALPMDFVDVSTVNLGEFASMYWGLGAQILRTAKRISVLPNAFGLHLTNFGCGADSFIEHFYRHIMGSKPYLILELDEHSAVAGVMTRLEAFKNVIDNTMQKSEGNKEAGLKLAN
jgi:predicted nucleotide-binding protein (sugar kinase/HSP70/actin superfamily)